MTNREILYKSAAQINTLDVACFQPADTQLNLPFLLDKEKKMSIMYNIESKRYKHILFMWQELGHLHFVSFTR